MALAVATQIGADNGELLAQAHRDVTPHDVGLRETMKQQKRRTTAAPPYEDRRLAGFDDGRRKVAEPVHGRIVRPKASPRTSVWPRRELSEATLSEGALELRDGTVATDLRHGCEV